MGRIAVSLTYLGLVTSLLLSFLAVQSTMGQDNRGRLTEREAARGPFEGGSWTHLQTAGTDGSFHYRKKGDVTGVSSGVELVDPTALSLEDQSAGEMVGKG